MRILKKSKTFRGKFSRRLMQTGEILNNFKQILMCQPKIIEILRKR